LKIKAEKVKAQKLGFIHGLTNGAVLLAYTVVVFSMWKAFPEIVRPSLLSLCMKVLLVILLLIGNFIGGNLVLKYKVGVED
jgi:uncharacterized membrane protein